MLLAGDPRAGGRRIEMLWNDGEGQFSAGDRTYLEIPSEDVRSFTMLQVPSEPIELVFVTEHALYRARTRENARDFGVVGKPVELSDAKSVVAADLNADEITELVVADANGISLLRKVLK
jgi:hypothetical protein